MMKCERGDGNDGVHIQNAENKTSSRYIKMESFRTLGYRKTQRILEKSDRKRDGISVEQNENPENIGEEQ